MNLSRPTRVFNLILFYLTVHFNVRQLLCSKKLLISSVEICRQTLNEQSLISNLVLLVSLSTVQKRNLANIDLLSSSTFFITT